MHTDRDIWINIFDEQNEKMARLQLCDAVKRVVTCELPDIFEMEAVKALAVAVRTTIVKRLKMFDGVGCEKYPGADISTGMNGYGEIANIELIRKNVGKRFDEFYNIACTASDITSGTIITCGGRPITADYHLTCGGGTENSEDVLGNRVMYFRKVLCKYCSNSPYWESTVDIPVKEIEDKLNVKIFKSSSISGPESEGIVDRIDRDETGRIRSIRIGGRFFTGKQIKDILGLNSSRFGWDPVAIRFNVRGSGEGLGMCLYGANSMAQQGKSYIDILKYYYTNIDIGNIDIADDAMPLKGKAFVIDAGHGGEQGDDEIGPSGLREKDVNLYIVKKLGEYLAKSGAQIIYTRVQDDAVPLPERVGIVNSNRPNFLISIHQNFFFASGVSGTEVYYYRGDAEGEKLSKFILDNIVKALGTRNRGCKTADMYILRESKVSSVVVECMHISNPEEESRLKDDKVKDETAKAIYRGIMDYYGI
ncbi:MAG: N-acetylmuramoyl-L-alanine amidase [Clostridiales bacterium]|nr:N-acetylmuramoyl-L-alanine amidase [Clostridiales bacterium]